MDDEETTMDFDTDDDPVTSLRNRLRHSSEFPPKPRARPVSFPPAFTTPRSTLFSFRKQKLLDRTPQSIRTSREAERTSALERSRKVKFADEAGQDLASYFEIPETKILSDLGSLLDNAIDEIEAEYEEKFGSRIPDVVPHIETIVPRKTIFDYLRGKEETILRHSRRRAHSCSPDRLSNKKFEHRPSRPLPPLVSPSVNKHRVFCVDKENIPERPSRGILKRTKPQKPKLKIETGDILTLSHSSRKSGLLPKPTLLKYSYEECIKSAIHKQETYDETCGTMSTDEYTEHLPSLGITASLAHKSAQEAKHLSCSARDCADNSEVVYPVNTSAIRAHGADINHTRANEQCLDPQTHPQMAVCAHTAFDQRPMLDRTSPSPNTSWTADVLTSAGFEDDKWYSTDHKSDFSDISPYKTLFKKPLAPDWYPVVTRSESYNDRRNETGSPLHLRRSKSANSLKNEGKLYEPLPKMSKNIPKSYQPDKTLFSETGLIKSERLLHKQPNISQSVSNKIRKRHHNDPYYDNSHVCRQDSIEEKWDDFSKNKSFDEFNLISQQTHSHNDSDANIEHSNSRALLFRSPSPKTELRQVRIIEKTVTIEETTYSPSLSPTSPKSFKYRAKVMPTDIRQQLSSDLSDCSNSSDNIHSDLDDLPTNYNKRKQYQDCLLHKTDLGYHSELQLQKQFDDTSSAFGYNKGILDGSVSQSGNTVLHSGSIVSHTYSLPSTSRSSVSHDNNITTEQNDNNLGQNQDDNMSFEMSLNLFEDTYEDMLSLPTDHEPEHKAFEDSSQGMATLPTSKYHHSDTNPLILAQKNETHGINDGSYYRLRTNETGCAKDYNNPLRRLESSEESYKQELTLSSMDLPMPTATLVEQSHIAACQSVNVHSNIRHEQINQSFTPICTSSHNASSHIPDSVPAQNSANNNDICNLIHDKYSNVEFEALVDTSIDKKVIAYEGCFDSSNNGLDTDVINSNLDSSAKEITSCIPSSLTSCYDEKYHTHCSVADEIVSHSCDETHNDPLSQIPPPPDNTIFQTISLVDEKFSQDVSLAHDHTVSQSDSLVNDKLSQALSLANDTLSQTVPLAHDTVLHNRHTNSDSPTIYRRNGNNHHTMYFQTEASSQSPLSVYYHFCIDKSWDTSSPTMFNVAMDPTTPEETFELATPSEEYYNLLQRTPSLMSDSITSDDISQLTYIMPDVKSNNKSNGSSQIVTQMSVEQCCTINTAMSNRCGGALSGIGVHSNNIEHSDLLIAGIGRNATDMDRTGADTGRMHNDERHFERQVQHVGTTTVNTDMDKTGNGIAEYYDNVNHTTLDSEPSIVDSNNVTVKTTQTENTHVERDAALFLDDTTLEDDCTESDRDDISIAEYTHSFASQESGLDRCSVSPTTDCLRADERASSAKHDQSSTAQAANNISSVRYDDLTQTRAHDWSFHDDVGSCDSSDSCHGSDSDEDEILSISIDSGSEQELSDSESEQTSDVTLQTQQPLLIKRMKRHRRSLSSDDISTFRSVSNRVSTASLTSVSKLSDTSSSLDIYSLGASKRGKHDPCLAKSVSEHFEAVCDRIATSEESVVTDEVWVDHDTRQCRDERVRISSTGSDSDTEIKSCCSWFPPSGKSVSYVGDAPPELTPPHTRAMHKFVTSASWPTLAQRSAEPPRDGSPCCAGHHAYHKPVEDSLSLDEAAIYTNCVASGCKSRDKQPDQSQLRSIKKTSKVHYVDV